MCSKHVTDEKPKIALWDNSLMDARHIYNRDDLFEYDVNGYLPVDDSMHQGQRKLLLAEVSALTKCISAFPCASDVIMIGAGPGKHTAYLATLFAKYYHFYLYDKTKYDKKLKEYTFAKKANVTLYNQYFGIPEALDWYDTGRQVIFISDIRTLDDGKVSESCVKADNDLNLNIIVNMRPVASLLKFRTPFEDGVTTMFDGDLQLPVWGRPRTSECRLFVTGSDIIQYNNRQYENMMYTFHRTLRRKIFNQFEEAEGACSCFDCTMEMAIWKEFIHKCRFPSSPKALFEGASYALDNPMDKYYCRHCKKRRNNKEDEKCLHDISFLQHSKPQEYAHDVRQGVYDVVEMYKGWDWNDIMDSESKLNSSTRLVPGRQPKLIYNVGKDSKIYKIRKESDK